MHSGHGRIINNINTSHHSSLYNVGGKKPIDRKLPPELQLSVMSVWPSNLQDVSKNGKTSPRLIAASSLINRKRTSQCKRKFSELGNGVHFKAAHCNISRSLNNKACETRLCTIKQDITQGRSDSAGQMSGKKIKPVYKWCTLGPDEDRIPCPGSESLAELCCMGSYF